MRYGEYMKEMSRLDRMNEEYKRYDALLGELSNHWMTYASHNVTGIVYDTTIIKQNLNKLREEIEYIEEKLDNE